MNKYTYYWSRFSLYLFSLPVTIMSIFIKRNNKRIIFNSFMNQKYNSNTKYLFIWFLENMKDYDCYFVINDDKLRQKLNSIAVNRFIETKSLAGKIFALIASVWFISGLEFPVSGFFLSYKRYVIHLGHGTPLKNIGLLENHISLLKRVYYVLVKTNISYAVASSNYFSSIISNFIGLPLKKVLIAGQSRNDQLFLKPSTNLYFFTKNKNMKNILYAPTWRTSAKTRLFPFPDYDFDKLLFFLKKSNINIFIRPHPDYEDDIDSDLLKASNIYLFSGKKYDEIMDYLNLFDLLITDYSSIYFDYLLLNRPVMFLPYDYASYDKEIGFTIPYYDYTPGYKPSTMSDFMGAIYESFYGIDRYENERIMVNNICNAYKQNNRESFVSLLQKMKILVS